MKSDPRLFSTKYLKRIWDHMGMDDGLYRGGCYLVSDAGHTVNGMWIDDVHAEMNRRGEGSYVIV